MAGWPVIIMHALQSPYIAILIVSYEEARFIKPARGSGCADGEWKVMQLILELIITNENIGGPKEDVCRAEFAVDLMGGCYSTVRLCFKTGYGGRLPCFRNAFSVIDILSFVSGVPSGDPTGFVCCVIRTSARFHEVFSARARVCVCVFVCVSRIATQPALGTSTGLRIWDRA